MGDDRVLVKQSGQLKFFDLAMKDVDYYSRILTMQCPRWREQEVVIESVAFSSDGKSVALGCATGLAIVVRIPGGYRVAMAPLDDAHPDALWLDARGETLDTYSTRPATSANPTRAEVTRWKVLNICPGSLDALRVHAFGGDLAVAPRGTGVVQISSQEITVWDAVTGKALVQATLPNSLEEPIISAISRDSRRIAVAERAGQGLAIISFDGDGHANTAGIPTKGAVLSTTFGGAADAQVAVAEASQSTVNIGVYAFSNGDWSERTRLRSHGWIRHAMPDDILMSPVALSPAGDVGYLLKETTSETNRDSEDYKTIRVSFVDGKTRDVSLPSAVSALVFQNATELVIGTWGGEIYAWSFSSETAEPKLIGRQDAGVLKLVSGADDYFVALDENNVVHMWRTGTSTTPYVGVRGFMETPLTSYGIDNYSELGIRGLSFGRGYLYVANRGADFNDYLTCLVAAEPGALLDAARALLH
jgi:hypothetical protein